MKIDPGSKADEQPQPGLQDLNMNSFYRSAFWMIASAVVALSVVALGFVISTKVDVGKLQVTIENLVEKQKELAEGLKSATNERYPTTSAIADKAELSLRISKLEGEVSTLKSEMVQVRLWQAEHAGAKTGGKD